MKFAWPLERNHIRRSSANNAFGMVRNGGHRPHQGWDLVAAPGTPCYAIADGFIEFASTWEDFGKMILLRFRRGDETLYATHCHLSLMFVVGANEVTRGTVIGLTGNTGNAQSMRGEDQHLHFEIRKQKFPGKGLAGRVDPAALYGRAPTGFTVFNGHGKQPVTAGAYGLKHPGINVLSRPVLAKLYSAAALVISIASGVALADTGAVEADVEVSARALVGLETSRLTTSGVPMFDGSHCIFDGDGMVDVRGVTARDWKFGQAVCNGRTVLFLERKIGGGEGAAGWRIVDVVLLPPASHEPVPGRPNALRFAGQGTCEWRGRTDTSFVATVRWAKRERIDWRTGVEKAWTFDIKRGRIVPLSTRHIVCYAYEP